MTRADDQDQIQYIEEEVRKGRSVAAGSAETPWDSPRSAVDTKIVKTGRYRAALNAIDDGAQLHLVILSALQKLHFEAPIHEHVEGLVGGAASSFDVVWLIRGEVALRFDL